jgi:TrmH family RNA methyltransferase
MPERPISERITSRSNPRVLEAVRLRDRRERERTGRTLIDGARELTTAISAGTEIEVVYALEEDGSTPVSVVATLEAARLEGIEVVSVSPPVLERLAFGDRQDGVVAVARIPDIGLAGLSPEEPALIVVIEGLEKPGNLGAILRTADAVGASVIAADPRTDPFNPNAIRASLGTIFTVPVAVASTGDTLAWLREREIPIVAARVDATGPYWSADFRPSVAVALGSEAQGLSDAWSGPGVTAVRLPMSGIADSLNVSTTAAVLLYEAVRQRESIAPGQ